jgi:four helix bundle protein
MIESYKNHFNEQLRQRTMNMAVEIRNLLLSVKVSAIDRPIVNQLIRSSSSVAANYRSATCARSDAEFLAKISIVLEESDESKFWLEYLQKIKVLMGEDIVEVQKEMDELVRIFSTIRKRMKEKTERGGNSGLKS